MKIESLELMQPTVDDKTSFLAGLAEMDKPSDAYSWVYLGESADLTFPERSFEEYVATLLKREKVVVSGFVTDTVYWAKINDQVVGRISLRHELNDFLKIAGGHIGYIVRPSYRGQGVATEMLKQILLMKRARAIGRLLLTCDEDNIASEKTILTNGGILENVIQLNPDKPKKKRFWISNS